MGAWPEREAPAERFASANFTVEKGMDSSIPFSFLPDPAQQTRDSPVSRHLPGYGSAEFINMDVEGSLNMEPFALKSSRRPQLHWWAVAGVCLAFFVWSFDLIPRIKSAATGSVAKTRDRTEPLSEAPLDGEWTPEIIDSPFADETQHSSDSDDVLSDPFRDDADSALSGLSEPSADDVQPDDLQHNERQPNNSVRSANIASGVSRGVHRDSRVKPASHLDVAKSNRDPKSSASQTVIPASVAATLRRVDEWLEDDKILDAHAELSRIYWKHTELRPLIQDRIDSTAAIIFSTSERQFGPPHFVEYGETLNSIAKQYDVPWEYLAMLNQVTAKNLQAGQELKVVRGPFGAVVDLSDFTLTVHAHGWYVNQYVIGTGRDDKTPLGEFTIQEKLENPTWYNPDGGVVEADDPENPLGEYWMGLGDHIGIHGTNDPDSIGNAASRGCIHLGDEDIVEVFSLLSTGSKVMIRK